MEIIDFLFAEDQLFTTITLIVLIALLIGNIVADKLKKYEDIDSAGATSLMDNDNLIILDVREKKERKSGYINNDIHIPLSNVKSQLDKLDKNKSILVYCRSGSRSAHIAGLLTRNEYENVYNLKGGIQAWKRAKLPVKT
ncbi:rhodanese-like domain-containing protein [Candidatus Thioglobus sp.]|jgi:rhodanese-related sulfurtransferase|uniref:rhodanese-like domain-containing protein n=1 Tax=Candidatus Thioglobus sp. TaxID=2026721 RepID=UPI001DB25FC2|nr:rhodanese-like domain-containing protein [Candidatus Thioglobus sp.]MBT3277239.1 rhodanese-like domain-containing protein [Candidatus Thioglobus sp.]MBT3446673.1 rhodanese-like domain-containing protein [Candidatus Thioglobus sp.]MBT3744808.1 rhodanese-like domain-containing protein [Candidatus Thioglobus sp.]MBT4001136.1 rhodanese-like domain-containing protein [Candidatus Thioglobus sp.]MBT4181869.1 rhodanese-like domain-containing protein [Candidatus Thioglobus sp.]